MERLSGYQSRYGSAHHPTAPPTVGPYALPVYGFVPGRTCVNGTPSYIYMYICIYIYVCIYTCIYVYMYSHIQGLTVVCRIKGDDEGTREGLVPPHVPVGWRGHGVDIYRYTFM